MAFHTNRAIGLTWLALGVLCLSACDNRNPNWKETTPVSGLISVDGVPAEGVSIRLHPVNGVDVNNPTLSSAVSDADGRFAIATYEAGDGAPAGEYRLTFQWGTLNRLSMSYDDDKLGGAYTDPAKSEITVVVNAGEKLEIGTIELLSTVGKAKK